MAKDKISPGMQQYLDVKKTIQRLFYFSAWETFTNYFMMTPLRRHRF